MLACWQTPARAARVKKLWGSNFLPLPRRVVLIESALALLRVGSGKANHKGKDFTTCSMRSPMKKRRGAGVALWEWSWAMPDI